MKDSVQTYRQVQNVVQVKWPTYIAAILNSTINLAHFSVVAPLCNIYQRTTKAHFPS